MASSERQLARNLARPAAAQVNGRRSDVEPGRVTRALYFTGRVGASIRIDLYAPVATILAFVLRVGEGADAPEAEAPPSARYDEDGRRLSP